MLLIIDAKIPLAIDEANLFDVYIPNRSIIPVNLI